MTEAGDHTLVLLVAPPDEPPSYRASLGRLTLRGIARLPAQAVTWIEDTGELSVRVLLPSQLVVDLRAIVGEEAEALERSAYLQTGTPKWKAISGR